MVFLLLVRIIFLVWRMVYLVIFILGEFWLVFSFFISLNFGFDIGGNKLLMNLLLRIFFYNVMILVWLKIWVSCKFNWYFGLYVFIFFVLLLIILMSIVILLLILDKFCVFLKSFFIFFFILICILE